MTNNIKITDKILIPFTIIFSTAINSVSDLGSIATNFFIPLCVFVYLIININRSLTLYKNSRLIKPFFYLLVIALLSYFTTPFHEVVLEANKKLFIVFIFSFTIYVYCVNSSKKIIYAYLSFLISYVIIILYSIFNFQILSLNSVLIESNNIDRNSIGYYIIIGLFSWNMICRSLFKSRLIVLILTILLYLISFFFCIQSASRGGVIILTTFSLLNIYFVFLKSRFSFKTIVTLSIVYLFMLNVLDTAFIQTSELKWRFNDLDDRKSPRQYHAFKALEIGLENPITGIGTNGYSKVPKLIERGSFTHNTYLELFVSYGIIGLLIYLISFNNIFISLRKFKKNKNSDNNVVINKLIPFLISFLLYNIFYVTYLTIEFMGILFLVLAHINTMINHKKHIYRLK